MDKLEFHYPCKNSFLGIRDLGNESAFEYHPGPLDWEEADLFNLRKLADLSSMLVDAVKLYMGQLRSTSPHLIEDFDWLR